MGNQRRGPFQDRCHWSAPLVSVANDRISRLSRQAWRALTESLQEIGQHRRVETCSRDHRDLPENDKADELAKLGANGRQQGDSVTF